MIHLYIVHTSLYPWTTQVWTEQVHLYTIFFNKYTVGPLYSCVLHPRIQTVSPVCGSESSEAEGWPTMHCSTLFYIRDLSIRRFWYLQGILEPVPCRHQGMTEVLGREMLILQLSTSWRVSTLNSHVVQESTVYKHSIIMLYTWN